MKNQADIFLMLGAEAESVAHLKALEEAADAAERGVAALRKARGLP